MDAAVIQTPSYAGVRIQGLGTPTTTAFTGGGTCIKNLRIQCTDLYGCLKIHRYDVAFMNGYGTTLPTVS
jgi:hypothetical protein